MQTPIFPDQTCLCGCGQKTNRNRSKKRGYLKGEPCKYLPGHNSRVFHPAWNGGRIIDKDGYVLIKNNTHLRANAYGYVLEHIIIVENVLGKSLPITAIIHHIDGNHSNNNHNNLIICQDRAYHNFLHARKRAYDACGNVKWVKCLYCKKYDNPENMYINPKNPLIGHHRKCVNNYSMKRRRACP